MSKRYSGKSFKDSSVMKKPKLTFKEKRKLKEEKKKEHRIFDRIILAVFLLVVFVYTVKFLMGFF